MNQTPILRIVRFVIQGALGGVIMPGVVVFLIEMKFSGSRPTYDSEIPGAIFRALTVFGGIVGAISGFIIGLCSDGINRIGVVARLVISIVLSAFFSTCVVALAPLLHDGLGVAVVAVVTMVLMIGILPAVTTPTGKRRLVRKANIEE
ncbi:MAG TPA: hypothetical protein VN643_12820 [Pyrinomonadaceae bacterium]|nr:hypothetical protein [Pyrinomonadaceae bacterium]